MQSQTLECQPNGIAVQQPRINESTPLLSGSSVLRSITQSLDGPSHQLRSHREQHHTFTENYEGSIQATRTSSLRSPSTSSSTVNSASNLQSDCHSGYNAENDGLLPESGSREGHGCPSPNWNVLPEGVSLRLENSGSVARDHLALERTFLAYMRTSLAIASAGVALVQLFSAAALSSPLGSVHSLSRYIQPLGASAVVIGLTILIIGVVRFFAVQSALTKGYFPVARISTGFVALMLTVLVTLTFAVLMAGKLVPNGT